MDTIGILVESAKESMRATERSMVNISEVMVDIQNIHEEVASTHSKARQIKISTNQQTSAEQQLAQTLDDLDGVAVKNADMITNQLNASVTKLSDLAQYMTIVLESSFLKKDSLPEREQRQVM